jgi:hypothetical protein
MSSCGHRGRHEEGIRVSDSGTPQGPVGAALSIEYLATDGKIDHLAHEYSGKRQINGVRNTHAPATSPATIEVTFPRGATIAASVSAKAAIKIEVSRGLYWGQARGFGHQR